MGDRRDPCQGALVLRNTLPYMPVGVHDCVPAAHVLMLGVMVGRAGLTIILLLLARMLELIIRENIDETLPWLVPFLPLESIANLVPFPLKRYIFQEIRDYLTFESIGIVLGWTFLFNYFSYLKLKRSDI